MLSSAQYFEGKGMHAEAVLLYQKVCNQFIELEKLVVSPFTASKCTGALRKHFLIFLLVGRRLGEGY